MKNKLPTFNEFLNEAKDIPNDLDFIQKGMYKILNAMAKEKTGNSFKELTKPKYSGSYNYDNIVNDFNKKYNVDFWDILKAANVDKK